MQTAPFVELVAVPAALAKNPIFDIIIDEKVTLQNYCNALIEKIFTLRQSKIQDFIDYQCCQVKNPLIWINKLEKLIASNANIFHEGDNSSLFTKLYTLIQTKRVVLQSSSIIDTQAKATKRQINADTDDRYFSFFEAKSYINSLENFNDKIIYLMDEIFEYNQADIVSLNNKLQPYDKQCNQLIEQLQIMRKVKTDFEKENQQNNLTENSSNIPFKKIKLNGPINIISNAFKQMMTTVKPNGQPYIDNKIVVVAHFLSVIFLDENGESISQATLQTYLSPNRTDKDPNNDVKVKL